MYSYEIYIESVFIINLVLNILILILTGRTLKLPVSRLRILAGGLIGALAYCLVLILPAEIFSYPMKILIGLIPAGILMCILTFRSRGAGNILRQTGFLFIFAFLIGGTMLFLRRQIPFINRYGERVWLILILGYTVFAVWDYFLRLYRLKQESHYLTVYIPCETKEVNIVALVDTGNGLIEPVSGKPVAVLEELAWEKLKPLMKPEKTKIIPYHNIGNAHGLMTGYELNEIYIEQSGRRLKYEKVIVAVGPGKISGKGKYQMILNPILFKNVSS